MSTNIGVLDSLYTTVLDLVARDKDRKLYVRRLLSVAQTLTSQEPASLDLVLSLVNTPSEGSPSQVKLQSFFNLFFSSYSDGSSEVRILPSSKSISSYLDKKDKSGEYWISSEEANLNIVEGSLAIMRANLEFNVCNIQSSSDPKILDTTRKDIIIKGLSKELLFASQSWMNLLPDRISDSTRGSNLINEIRGFILSPQLLFWIELVLVSDGVQTLYSTCLRLYNTLLKVSI
jgi:hypothetical protein